MSTMYCVHVYIFPAQVSNLLEPQSTTIKSCFPASSQICSYRLGDFIYFISWAKAPALYVTMSQGGVVADHFLDLAVRA